ncbi:MAG: hypothetical protein IPP80_12515 [Ignavibacteria bacterium]|nr:hypothetical protein [Ignavibacteria bacterium]
MKRPSFFAGDEVVGLIDRIMIELKGAGGAPTPSLIESVRRSTDPFVAASSSLIIDVALRHARAERLGKRREMVGCSPTKWPNNALIRVSPLDHAVCRSRTRACAEICTGAGLDAAALAAVSGRVTSFEADPIIADITAGNLHRTGITNVDVVRSAWPPCDAVDNTYDGVWADPSRRSVRGRQRSGQPYEPSLSVFHLLP